MFIALITVCSLIMTWLTCFYSVILVTASSASFFHVVISVFPSAAFSPKHGWTHTDGSSYVTLLLSQRLLDLSCTNVLNKYWIWARQHQRTQLYMWQIKWDPETTPYFLKNLKLKAILQKSKTQLQTEVVRFKLYDTKMIIWNHLHIFIWLIEEGKKQKPLYCMCCVARCKNEK